MLVYRGTVKDNTIVLPEGVHIEDGTSVEVRTLATEQQLSEEEAEDAFLQDLLEAGIITEIKRPSRTAPPGDRTPIKVEGKPLSQIIIEDRR